MVETRDRMFERIAGNVVRERKARGMSQDDLAHAAGITLVQIQKLEDGRHRHLIATLRKVADALGVDEDIIIG